MAFDADDIRQLKAAIPDHLTPPHGLRGKLSDDFSSVGSRSESTALQGSLSALDRFNLGQACLDQPDASGPSFQLTGAQAMARQTRQQQHDSHEAEEERSFVKRVLAALDARLAALDAQLTQIDDRLEAIRKRRVEIGDTLEAMDKIERLKKSGRFDPDNKEHAALLRQAGLSADEVMGDDFAAVLARRRKALGDEDADLETDWNAKMKRRSAILAERDAVIDAKHDIETADSEEARLLAERRAQTLLGKQQLGTAAYDSARADARKVAADAIGSSEADAVQSNSVALNQQAVAKDAQAIVAADGADFELDGDPRRSDPPKPR